MRSEGNPLRAQLHADDFIPVAEVDTTNTHGYSSGASYIRIFEADTLTVFGYQNDIFFVICEFYFDQFIIIFQRDRRKTVFLTFA